MNAMIYSLAGFAISIVLTIVVVGWSLHTFLYQIGIATVVVPMVGLLERMLRR